MAEFSGVGLLAPILAALSAAALICAIFFPLITRSRLVDKRSTVFEALLKGRSETLAPATRTVRRAQEAALKSVAQQSKVSRMLLLESRLAAAGVAISPRFYLALCFTFGAMIFSIGKLAGFATATAFMISASSAWLAPQRYLAFRINHRKQAFLNAFPAAVDMIIRGAKSGLSLMDCLAIVASDAAAPVRQEFEVIVTQLRAGVPLATTIDKLAMLMPVPEVRFFVMIMSAQSQTGGNLTEALSNLSRVLRDREKIAAKTRVASAEGRVSALIIGALPFAVIGTTIAFAPQYISYFWMDDVGRRIAFFCALWLASGIFVLGRIARIEI